MRKKAIWNGKVLAESDDLVKIEGNYYFPKTSMNMEHFEATDTHTTCPWKGTASYHTVKVDGQENKDAAWHYKEPKSAATVIKDRVAFGKGVEIVDS
ncbi:MAG: hypothetical protein DHS20C18_33820 [Saprospiraceae bacterium]|nr:MAG: hypothetical protein DHS20C18_33820 [Saprospiraceae bacterium]